MDNQIILNSKIHIVDKILKNTRAQFFTDMCVGDRIQFSMSLGGVGRGRWPYATYIHVTNLTQDTSTKRSLDELDNRLANFELVPADG